MNTVQALAILLIGIFATNYLYVERVLIKKVRNLEFATKLNYVFFTVSIFLLLAMGYFSSPEDVWMGRLLIAAFLVLEIRFALKYMTPRRRF